MSNKLKYNILTILLFGVIALTALSPIAGSTYLPKAQDFNDHISGIVQAKLALDEGQFPIRVAPLSDWLSLNLRFPVFQFYSPLPYTVAALIYKFITPHNPFDAFKITIWLSLVFGAYYIYRLLKFLTGSHEAALLSGIAYMIAPYYLANINVRGDFTESIAQGILPVALYYIFEAYLTSMTFKKLAIISIAWFALIITHLITFFYTSIILGLLLLWLTIKCTEKWQNLFWIGLACVFSCFLAAWYLLPIVYFERLLSIHGFIHTPYIYHWLTPLLSLISPASVSPQLMPGNGQLNIPLHAAVGWPMLLGAGIVAFVYLQPNSSNNKPEIWLLPVLILFLFALFLTWSPIDFWSRLPYIFSVAQFSYRLLTQVMWLGVLLFGWALVWLFKNKLNRQHVVLGLFLLGLSSGSWLLAPGSGNKVEQLVNNPVLANADTFSVMPKKLPTIFIGGNIQLPFTTQDGWLINNSELKIPYRLVAETAGASLHIQGNVPPAMYNQPIDLYIFINDIKVVTKTIRPGEFNINIPLKDLVKTTTGHDFKLKIATNKDFVPQQHDPKSADTRHLTILVDNIQFINTASDLTIMPVSQMKPYCQQQDKTTVCKITVLPNTGLIQLPVLYYPKLLSIRVNGKPMDYLPTYSNTQILVALQLPPNNYSIKVYFRGLVWANWISAIAWLLLIIAAGINFLFAQGKYKH